MAQDALVRVLSHMIEIGIRMAIDVGWQIIKERWLARQTKQMERQSKIQSAMSAMRIGSSLFSFFGFQHGGAVSKGKPVVVGESGPEMFIPNTSGQITQNARGTGGSPVNVNFSITALDARGFEEMLVQNRGALSSIINEAVNERGAKDLI